MNLRALAVMQQVAFSAQRAEKALCAQLDEAKRQLRAAENELAQAIVVVVVVVV